MAFLGDLGKFFNIETREAAEIGTAFATGGIGAGLGATLDAVVTPIPQGETRPADVSAPPAGVDSPATLAPVSQTAQTGTTFRIPPAGQGFGMPRQAFIGGLFPGMTAAGRALSRIPGGTKGLITGTGAGLAVDFFLDQFGEPKKLVITRKMQRDVKKLFMLSGGDFNAAADLYAAATGRRLTGEQVVKIITKTFKNQGPYVTKAAVRKTRATIRKMETLCDLKDRLCPPRTTRRRTPARRSSTMITQVK